MKVSIYRVEQPRGGSGPYSSSYMDKLERMFFEHNKAFFATPKNDPLLLGINSDEYCGFATLEALELWFGPWFQELHDSGFLIATYSVPLNVVRYGTNQAVFRRGDHWPISSMPMR